MSRRVAITGIGLVTGLGVGVESTWRNLIAGRSAIGPIRAFDASSLQTQLGAEIPEFRVEDFGVKPRALRMMMRADGYAFAAATLAMRDAGWDADQMKPERVAVYLGGNKEVSDPERLAEAARAARAPDGSVDIRRFGSAAFDATYPLFYVEGLPGSSIFFISEAYGFTGPNTYFAGTAESGAIAIGTAFRAIARGEADVAVAGGFDDPVSWWNLSKLDAMGVLSDRNDRLTSAFRPFDRQRSGSVLGDGAAILALEELEAARGRGARIYAEIGGFGSGMDNSAMLTPNADGRDVAIAVSSALRESDLPIVDLVVAHGSATLAGDPTEARGLATAFGPDIERVPCTAIKPATGHLVAAAGALNVAVGALAIREGCLPPTLNYEDADPNCALDIVTEPRDVQPKTAVAIARGVEGQAAAIVLRS